MPFHGIYGQFGAMAIIVKGFYSQLWLGSESSPGKGEGQEYINNNISSSSLAKKGWDAHSAG